MLRHEPSKAYHKLLSGCKTLTHETDKAHHKSGCKTLTHETDKASYMCHHQQTKKAKGRLKFDGQRYVMITSHNKIYPMAYSPMK